MGNTERNDRVDEFLGAFHELMTLATAMDEGVKDFGVGMLLSRAETHAVEAVGVRSEITIGGLATALGTTSGAVSQLVKKLEAKGLVAKRRGGVARKEVFVALTDLGRRAFEAHESYHRGIALSFERHFGENLDEWLQKSLPIIREMTAFIRSSPKTSDSA